MKRHWGQREPSIFFKLWKYIIIIYFIFKKFYSPFTLKSHLITLAYMTSSTSALATPWTSLIGQCLSIVISDWLSIQKKLGLYTAVSRRTAHAYHRHWRSRCINLFCHWSTELSMIASSSSGQDNKQGDFHNESSDVSEAGGTALNYLVSHTGAFIRLQWILIRHLPMPLSYFVSLNVSNESLSLPFRTVRWENRKEEK